jgi:hypothetical protein
MNYLDASLKHGAHQENNLFQHTRKHDISIMFSPERFAESREIDSLNFLKQWSCRLNKGLDIRFTTREKLQAHINVNIKLY